MPDAEEDLSSFINQKIENLRPRLLDLSRRNPLVATKLTSRSNSHLRVVDELPDMLFYHLCNGQEMRFIPLPALEDDPRDEQTEAFSLALSNGRLTDPDYLAAAEKLDGSSEDYLDLNRKVERALKDRIRAQLGLAPRQEKSEVNLVQHARNNGIAPTYDLPIVDRPEDAEKYSDLDIQTLLLPKDLERKLSALNAKCNTWRQETGLNVLHGAFGFLEWREQNSTESSFAPLILVQVRFEKRNTKDGLEFWVSGNSEEAEINAVISEKLRLEFGIELPSFESGSIESYLKEVSELSPKSLFWRVRRQVVFGVFPSARMAMYHDLNTEAANFAVNEIIRPLFGGSDTAAASPFADEYQVDDPEIERAVPYLVLDADSSQFSTLVDVASKKNVAVEGPPGTGKSQTIVNAIASALATGRKVLFVAEKTAALDVVRSRLESIELGEFLLPLQAEHSTRENVIQSLRERLEMVTGSPAQNYENQVAEFRRTRDETALYINILSEKFEDTGLTVHDILGRSIGTGDALSTLPNEFRLAPFPIQQGLNADSVRSYARKGDELDGAWQIAGASPTFWKNVKVTALNRFDVEEILYLASTLAQSLEQLDERLGDAQQLGISSSQLPENLPLLEDLLERARQLKGYQATHVARFASASVQSALRNFFEDCRRLREVETILRIALAGEISNSTVAFITEIESICAEYGLDNLDVNAIAQKAASKRRALAMALRLVSQVRPFIELVPGSEHWRFVDFGKLKETISIAGHPVIHMRHSAMADPAAPALLREFNARGRQLSDEHSILSKKISLSEMVSIEQLSECLATLKGAGSWRFFSPSFRRATRFYRRLSKTKFQLSEAIDLLEKLIDWRTREVDLRSDPRAVKLYGIHFRGIKTDFALFEKIVEFYDAMRVSFPDPDQKPIRDFLLLGDAEKLLQVPTLDGHPEKVTLKIIEESLPQFETEALGLERACERLRVSLRIFNSPENITTDFLPVLKRDVSDYVEARQRLDRNPEMSAVFGDEFRGSKMVWEDYSNLVSVCEALIALGPAGEEMTAVIAGGNASAATDLLREIESLFRSCEDLAGKLNTKTGLEAKSILNIGSFADRARALHGAAKDSEGLKAHSEFARVKAELDARLHGLAEAYLAVKGDYAGFGGVLEAMAFRSLARRAYERHGATLAKFSGSKLNELRAKLALLDRKIIEGARRVLRAKIKDNARPPRGNGVGRRSSWSDLALIENECSKKQRYIPVRDLTRRAAKALLELKPCWMMSPLAVAQYLPKGLLTFDLCIIDEASQMPPEDSIGALVRSRQAMIVGDTNQLPPSNFFRKLIDSDEDDEEQEDKSVLSESILEMANATFRPVRRLRWHYRSRHSGLIKFSNRFVYNDDLVVFPSATESVAGMGVNFRSVAGLYKSGTNAIEAHEMVDAAIRFMKEDRDRSLGIVTLNQKQRELIFEEMEFALSRDPIAASYVEQWAERNGGLEEFFIKNLENVQGDERDVIFIGTVYGPEEPGAKVMQRFGPINGMAGKRRLNVLFSRARQQIVTFSSMRAEDITAEERDNQGAYMLKRWLEYSATGVLDSGDVTHNEPDSDLEVFVMQQIRAMGCIPIPQVGVRGYSIDIGVKHPQWPHGFILGVECDGAAYHSSKSARDRDRLRQDVLEGLRWRFHRIWSTDWFNNPAQQAEILRKVITERMIELKAKERDFCRPPEVQPASLGDVPGPIAATATKSELTTAHQSSNKNNDLLRRVSVGDTVRVRYLTDDKKVVQFTISPDLSSPETGIIHFKKPIAEALLGAEEGDEVEILVGSYLRRAVLEKIVSRQRSTDPKYQ